MDKFTLQPILNFLLPRRCALCNEVSPKTICNACYDDFIFMACERCPQCGIPLEYANRQQLCGDCIKTPPFFDQTIVGCHYRPPLDSLILALKFAHTLTLAPVLADILRDAILRDLTGDLPDTIAPVPLGQARLIDRGFNQSHEIARPLSRDLGIRLIPKLLFRIRETQAQSLLHPNQRYRNTRSAFLCNLEHLNDIEGKHVALVDDVMTTGTTLNELAKTLKHRGARKVSNFVVARTPRRD